MREEPYCLSCRKYTKNINKQYAIVKNLDLLKNN